MSELNFDGRHNDTPVGYYTYVVGDDVWSWSDGMYELHGYEPHAMPASTDLMLKHKHPDDAQRAFEALEAATSNGLPFSCYHRIISARGDLRYVLSVGRGLFGARGRVEEVTGYFVDLTGVRHSAPTDEDDAADDAALVRAAQTRSTVDQAKGIVMVALGCDDVAAFALLRAHADEKETTLAELARALVQDVASRPLVSDRGRVSTLDELLERPPS